MKLFVDLTKIEEMKTVDITGYPIDKDRWRLMEDFDFTIRVKVPKDFNLNSNSKVAAEMLSAAFQDWYNTPPHSMNHSLIEIAMVSSKTNHLIWMVSRITDI